MATKHYSDFAYHDWNIGETITQDKMDRIEKGIESAFALANEKASSSDLQSLTSSVEGTLSSFSREIDTAKQRAQQALNATSDGTNAWNQLSGAGVTSSKSLGTVLAELLSSSKSYTDTEVGKVNTAINGSGGVIERLVAVENLSGNSDTDIDNIQIILDGIKGIYDSPAARINNIEGDLSTTKQALQTLSNGGSGSNYNTLAARLTAIDGDTVGFRHILEIDTEVKNARGKDENNDDYTTLSARLNANDNAVAAVKNTADGAIQQTKIEHTLTSSDTTRVLGADQGPAITSSINNAKQDAITTANSYSDTYKIAKTSIYNGLDKATDDGSVLDARQGKALRDLIGGNFDANSTVAARIDAIDNVSTGTVAVLAGKVSALETEVDINAASGNSRIDNVEIEVTNARTSHVIQYDDNGTMTDTTYDSLDARLETIEAHAAAVRSDVDTIAGELSMVDTNGLTTIGTRVDDIEYDISHTATLEDNTTGLTQRIGVAESDIDTLESTLGSGFDTTTNTVAATITAAINTAASDATSKANAAQAAAEATASADATTKANAAQSAAETYADTNKVAKTSIYNDLDQTNEGYVLDARQGKALDTRISTLENQPKSATVIIDNTNITYDNNGVPTNIGQTPTEDKDYLLQGPDPSQNESGKYYYWKYIGISPNGTWNLISGSESGSGNNNAEVFNSTQAFELATKEENKDYYVIDNQTWHHYRYIYDSVNDRYNLIEIGQNLNIDYIKRYNITTYDGDNVTYLDLYEFPYGVNKTSENIDPVTDATYRIARLELPQGGGSFDDTQYRLYGRVIGDQTIKKSLAEVQADGDHVILRFGYTCYAKTGEGENDYDYKRASYVLTAEDGTVISTSNGNTISYLTKSAYNQNNYNPELVFDVTNYYTLNETNAFRLTLTVNVGNNEIKTKDIDVYVNIIQLTLDSTFSDANTLSIYNSIEIPFTFSGMENEDYTLYVLLDNQPIQFSINRGRIIIAPNQLSDKIGVHALQIYASQTVNNETLNSNNLYYQLGLIGADNLNSIMLFSGTSLDVSEIEQYKILNLPYTLYIPSRFESTQTVTIRVDQVDNTYTTTTGNPIIRDEVLESKKYTYPFRINKMYATDEYYLVTISCENANTIVFKVHVKQAEEQIEIRTNNLLFNFDPTNDNYTNTLDLEHRLWQQTNNGTIYKMQIPEGTHFDWRTGGWTTIKDENNNNISCFCVKAGSRVEFVKKEAGESEFTPLTLFWHNMETAGSNFKCVFKIDNVKSPKAQFLTSLDNTEHRITQYGDWVEDKYQDIDLKKTLLSTYLNVKTNYIYYYNMDPVYLGAIDTETDNGDNAHDEKLGTTVLANENVSTVEAIRAADESDARKKNTKKIKEYIHNIYTTISQIDASANYSGRSYKTFLLDLLRGNEAIQEEEEGKDPVEEAIIRNLMTLNDGMAIIATNVYKNLMGTATGESAADIALMAAYREFDAPGFNAITNGFVVEGKEKKDGIIAKLQFYIKAITKSFTPLGNAAVQTISAEPISTNPNAKTAIYRVTIGLPNENTRIYEVNIADVYGNNNNLLWTKVSGLRDATVTESHHYGLELNASGSYMYLPTGTLSYAHSEGDIIEFEYNINSELEGHIDSSVIIYEDGVPSAADIYTRNKGIFEQYNSTNNTSTAQSLTIGSDECDVYIFKMRLYNEALENSDILANFCADGLTPDDMSDRYNRNKKLVDVTSKGQEITPSLVAEACPDLRVIMIEAPRLTGGKTSFIRDTKIRCIYKNGRPEDNWVALNAYHAGQGTSSDNYGAAGRNLDIMFGFDGEDFVIVPKPNKNNYSFDPSYVSTLIKGIDNSLEANQNTILDAAAYSAQSQNYEITTNGTGKVALSSTSVPNNWFNIKLNIASSENTNNAFLQKRFDTFLPYKDQVPARIRGRNLSTPLDIKNDMEFFNCVVFIKETGTPSEFTNDSGENRSWHFYGIGNIGDSKKTDSTRVNVPGDPQEFCVELSDNGLKNSEFSTGIFYTPLDEDETYTEHELSFTPTDLHECTVSEYTNNDGYTLNIANPSTTTLYLIKEVLTKYTQYRRFMYINSQFVEIGRPIAFENLEVGIRYPVSEAEWKTSLNTYQKQLNNPNRAKGWDKSFEFRYDLTTKDGETIERNELEKVMNDMHQEINKQKFVDLYEWIVMSSDDDFKAHLQDWFIEKSPLYWYLFTERYTMIDSRAKNTFYHYGKVYISDDEYAGTVKDTLNNMTAEQYLAAHSEITDKGNITALQIATAELTFQRATAQSIYDNRDTFLRDDPQNNSYPSQFNNGYRFELWDYDNDTALGINNNGQMVFEAGLEDVDKTTSGWVYNAAESVIWCRIRDNMYDKLSELYIQLKATDCFNDESLIQQFDTLQTQFPEELWRLDFERKYFRPFKDSGETTYLSSMANGRKKYQRRQFERNMAIYISSKYLTNASYIANDQISFRPNRDIIPPEEAIITVKPYSTMYINFMIGNAENDIANDPDAKSAHVRIKANESYQIHARDFVDRFQNFQCVIYNACRVMSIEGIDKFECKQFIFSNAKKLTALKLGGSHSNSGNVANIGDLGLNSEIPLLEELDISNIRFENPPPAELSLDRFPLLKKFNAENSNIRHFTFKDGGLIEEIKYFPGDMDKINFKNLYKLSIVEFQENASFSNLTEYTSENSYSNSYQIVQNMLNNAGQNGITQLKLNDINWTIGNIDELEPLVQLQNRLQSNMYLAGTVNISGTWSEVEKTYYEGIWHNIQFNVIDDAEHKKTKYLLTYLYEVNGVSTSYNTYVNNGATIYDIKDNGTIPIPSRPSTDEFEYRFGSIDAAQDYVYMSGWRIQGDSETLAQKEERLGYIPTISGNTTIEAVFNSIKRKYPVRWLINNTVVKTSEPVEYGTGTALEAPTVTDIQNAGFATYTYNINRSTNPIEVSYKIFNGWQKLPINIRPENTNTYDIEANYLTATNVSLASIFEDTTNLTPAQLLIFSKLNDNERAQYIPAHKQFSLQLGYQGSDNTGELLIGPGSTHQLTSGGQSSTVQAYNIARFSVTNNLRQTLQSPLQPLKAGADEFTLAIDYQFDSDYINNNFTGTEAVLMACYEGGASVAGFKLYYRKGEGPKISFGDTSITNNSNEIVYERAIGSPTTAKYRNTLVLRHPAGSPTLYIYSGIGTQGSNDDGSILSSLYDEDLNNQHFIQTIEWQNVNTNAHLVFGNVTIDNSSSIMVPAKGKIFWAKYWNKDLGAGECRQLAAWNHEIMTYGIEEYAGMNPQLSRQVYPDTISNPPNLVVTSLTSSNYGYVAFSSERTEGATVSWPNSKLQSIANKRIFNSLPITLQSIITKSPVRTRQAKYSNNTGFSSTWTIGNTEPTESRDYIFFASSVEYGNIDGAYIGHEAKGAMNWRNTTKVNVFSYNSGTGSWSTATSSASYMNLRFPGYAIKTEGEEINRIFTGYNGSDPVYNKINNITRGDIVIYNDTDAYMYVTSADVALGAPIRNDTSGFFYCDGGGGWIKADSYWTRSPFTNHGSAYTIMYVNSKGTLITNADGTTAGCGLNYSFSI